MTKKTAHIQIRASASEKELWQNRATSAGLSLTAWIRRQIDGEQQGPPRPVQENIATPPPVCNPPKPRLPGRCSRCSRLNIPTPCSICLAMPK